MEIILKISTSKKLAVLLFLIITISSLTAQDINDKDFYREDQFYFGSSYFIQTEQVTDFKQNGFSGNFQFGFIRDIPLNKTSTNALGIGVGFERNLFTSNIQPLEVDGEIEYDIIVSRFLESKNKISFSSIAIPIEYRWRKSSVDVYRFWRIYSGLKIKKNFSLYSNPSYGKELKIKDKKYYIIDFNKLSKKPLKKVVSSANAKRLSASEIEKIIQFGIDNNDL